MRELTEKIFQEEYGFICPKIGKVTTEDGETIECHDWYYTKGNMEIWWIFTGISSIDIFYYKNKKKIPTSGNCVEIKNLPMIKYCEDLEYIYKLITGKKLTKKKVKK